MLEEENGKLYGRHKVSKEEEIAREEVAYVEEKWANLEVSDILAALEKAKS
jgi:hypothetical protein